MSATPPRPEGWYAVLIGDGLCCLYWTGTHWQIPRRVYARARLPAAAVVADAPIEWPGDPQS
jgi:hypothetical protein